jgi:hypothetical protein
LIKRSIGRSENLGLLLIVKQSNPNRQNAGKGQKDVIFMQVKACQAIQQKKTNHADPKKSRQWQGAEQIVLLPECEQDESG